MGIRKVLADTMIQHEDGIVPPDYPLDLDEDSEDGSYWGGKGPPMPDPPRGTGGNGGEEPLIPSVATAKAIVLVVALIGAAATVAGTLAYLTPDATTRGMNDVRKRLERLQVKAKSMPQWREAQAMSRKLVMSLFRSKDPAEELGFESRQGAVLVARFSDQVVADMWDDGSGSGYGGRSRGVSKTKVKVAIRVFTVVAGLIATALKLFSYFSEWEDDPGMVELFHDTKAVASSLRQNGVSSALEKAHSNTIYRTIRNTSGLGFLLPRGGRRIIPRG